MKTASMLQQIIGMLPTSFLRLLGRLYDRSPLFQSIIDKPLSWALGEGRIQRGPGKGLRFDAAGQKIGYLLGTSDYEEQKYVESMLDDGFVFYDIGANIGFFTLIAARCVGPDGFVYAFEPSPQTASQLRKNVLRNAYDNVEIVEAAANSWDGIAELVMRADSDKNTIDSARHGGISVEVKSVKMDTWREGKRPPDIIKIDVEGAEIDVLYGAMDTIERFRPILFVEVHRIGAAFDNFVTEHLSPLGYRASTLFGEPLPNSNGIRFHAHLQQAKDRNGKG